MQRRPRIELPALKISIQAHSMQPYMVWANLIKSWSTRSKNILRKLKRKACSLRIEDNQMMEPLLRELTGSQGLLMMEGILTRLAFCKMTFRSTRMKTMSLKTQSLRKAVNTLRIYKNSDIFFLPQTTQ